MPLSIPGKRSALRRAVREGRIGVWGAGLCLDATILMAVGLLLLVGWKSLWFFWPHPLAELRLEDGSRALGIVWDEQTAQVPGIGKERVQLKVGNRRAFGIDFRWIDRGDIEGWGWPARAVAVERTEYGDLYGWLERVVEGDQVLAEGEAAWGQVPALLREARALLDRSADVEDEMGDINGRIEALRLQKRRLQLADGASGGKVSQEKLARINETVSALDARFEAMRRDLDDLLDRAAAKSLVFRLSDGRTTNLPVSHVVRIYRPNAMGMTAQLGVYLSKWWEFVSGEPRESNTEGGVFPAIFGTFFLVLLMSVAAVPLGVIAALYLGEYARMGPLVRLVRIAVQNLAGVPSIVFGVFGLGFFVYGIGGTIDRIFFPERLPTPTFGTGGVLWASLTLALLTVPVVIVATEEALRAVPRAVRQASYGLGATQWQTVRRVVLPAALPGVLTGLILAVARGAGEVAPLMITGVVKLAPALPVDGQFPFLHLDRKFMHLAFHIYDVGFQSPNVEAAKPMVYMTTLLLLSLVLALNLVAIKVRARLRRKYRSSVV